MREKQSKVHITVSLSAECAQMLEQFDFYDCKSKSAMIEKAVQKLANMKTSPSRSDAALEAHIKAQIHKILMEQADWFALKLMPTFRESAEGIINNFLGQEFDERIQDALAVWVNQMRKEINEKLTSSEDGVNVQAQRSAVTRNEVVEQAVRDTGL